jgi:hypothetical protein
MRSLAVFFKLPMELISIPSPLHPRSEDCFPIQC